MSENMSLATPLHVKVAVADERRLPRALRAAKSARVLKPSESEIRRGQLTVAAIRMAHQRSLAAQLAFSEKSRNAEKAKIVAAVARAKSSVEREEKISGKPSLVTALLEDVPVRSLQPFGLVLAKPETEEDVALPSRIPLPEARPLIETVVIEQKPADEKPVARRNLDNKDSKEDVAYAKPERSLFSDLFKGKASDTAWPGKGTRVAIYDVSNATVYLPDGTKLRAHSGIGRMRDNPRYEHVTMKGPTPAGIYRLSMREKRFYGVEAIRMTSIDGRDPQNRTGLLTHTNLLRGQKGSHGCVAFQNYQPFLKAFKRGRITMLVVVPELPSSRTQLAALYRKAGA
ncbi:DUF2778 domain-containing protein [Rhizobium sp. LjRoot254]|uniref:DUF2778 domain-containing protein n=1 Tax=Rhizobium sp. LjRoot254 TaxID=3342297 RepID=UPI003ECF8E9D